MGDDLMTTNYMYYLINVTIYYCTSGILVTGGNNGNNDAGGTAELLHSNGSSCTTVRLTTAEVVQLPHVCRVHNLQYIFYTSAVTFFI